MYRKKEKTQSGCTRCRIRRKKCDEHKPACCACERLRLHCVYEGPRRKKMAPPKPKPELNVSSDIYTRTQQQNEHCHRIGDFSPQAMVESLCEVFRSISEQYIPARRVLSEQVKHAIISGVCFGWHTVLVTNEGDTMPAAHVHLLATADRIIKKFGHGQVARMAFVRLYHMLSQVWAR